MAERAKVAKKEKEKTFEEKLSHLEDISAKLQEPGTDLNTVVSLYEEGMRLANELEKTLAGYERRVEIINTPLEEDEQGGGGEAFDSWEDGSGAESGGESFGGEPFGDGSF